MALCAIVMNCEGTGEWHIWPSQAKNSFFLSAFVEQAVPLSLSNS